MSQAISNSPFCLLPPEIPPFILMQLPMKELDTTSLICTNFFQLSQKVFFDKFFEYFKSFKHPSVADRACKIALKYCKNMSYCQKIAIIQAITAPLLRFNECLSMLPASSDDAQKTAEDAAAKIKDKRQSLNAYLQLFKATKDKRYAECALPDYDAFDFYEALIIEIKVLKVALKVFTNVIDASRVRIRAIELYIKYFPKLRLSAQILFLVKRVDLSCAPKNDLDFAYELDKQHFQEYFNEGEIDNVALTVRLKVILAYQKISPTIDSAQMEHLDKMIKTFKDNENNENDEDIYVLMPQAIRRNVNLARQLAAKIVGEDFKLRAYLMILESTKNIEDLMIISQCRPLQDNNTINKAINIALHDFKNYGIAREFARNLNDTLLTKKDYYKSTSFIEIYKVTKEKTDLEEAERFLDSIAESYLKINAYRKLFEINGEVEYRQKGLNMLPLLSTLEETDQVSGFLDLAKLTNDIQYLIHAIEIFCLSDDSPLSQNSNLIIKDIIHVCINFFMNHEKAIDLVQFVSKRGLHQSGVDKLIIYITDQLMMQKKFDEALFVDHHFK
jgi:hypothetical protein